MIFRTVKHKSRSAITLMEMVVALAIMAVIFTAVLPQFRLISNSWDSRQASADTIQNGRVFVDYLNRTLAKAVRITDVSSSTDASGYIEYEDIDGNTYRCDLASNNYIEFGLESSLADLAGPVSSLKFICYTLDNLTTPTTTVEDIRYVTVQAVFINAAPNGQNKTFTASAFLQANGNVTEVVDPTPSLPGIIVKDKVNYGGSTAVFDSYYSSQGPYNSLTSGSGVVISTNSTGSDKFTLYSNALIKGDAYIGKNGNISRVVKLWGGSTITGTIGTLDENLTFVNNTFPSGSPFTGNASNLNLWGNMVEVVTEDTYYNNVNINSGTTLIVNGDVTIAVKGNVQIGDTGSIELTPGSTLNLYLKGSIGIGGDINLNGTPNDCRIYMTSNKTFQTYSQADVFAVLSNPNGNVEFWNNRPFYGRIQCKNLAGNSPIHIDLSSFLDGESAGSSSSSSGSVTP